MDTYIKVYDDVFSHTQCQHYINLIEKGNQYPGGVEDAIQGNIVKPKMKISTDINVSQDYPEEVEFILETVRTYIKRYREELNILVPVRNAELICGRVYRENEGFYKQHVDAINMTTCNRLLTALFYLNEVEGGEIEFPKQQLKINPMPGRLVLFPPYWMFPHIAHKSTKGDRYIIRVFLTL